MPTHVEPVSIRGGDDEALSVAMNVRHCRAILGVLTHSTLVRGIIEDRGDFIRVFDADIQGNVCLETPSIADYYS